MAKRTENHDDMSKFKNRLWYLMEQKEYKAARDLATSLYDEGLAEVNSKDNIYNSEEEKRKNAIGSIEKKINKHLSADDTKNVQGEFINAYCKHFGCSADYLFGFSKIRTNNPQVKKICNLTGLSEAAVNKLIKECTEQEGVSYIHECWSALIESDLFMSIPFDWHSAYNEICEFLKCDAALQAIDEVTKDEDESSFEYNIVAIKGKPIRKARDGHYAAYYGMLYKLAQSISQTLDLLSVKESGREQVYEKELKQMKYQFAVEIAAAKGEPLPKRDDGEEFQFHSHIIV
ncbi:hypothetical protein DW091_13380 [Eubacterium sp. AM05-23]|uniref:hypothetical protein n=1 Tax=Eubacterium TaxID=1730 RepID=UPI000E46A1F1|nr:MULTISPECIES: hypothetical protein [Eubacterium]RHO56689.1 hypothetical protein DW091_13380 [Eubacterium sp. AM05-23]